MTLFPEVFGICMWLILYGLFHKLLITHEIVNNIKEQ